MRRALLIACWVVFFSWNGSGGVPHKVSAERKIFSWEIDRMTCEYRINPLGLDEAHPRFAWTFRSSQRGQYQSAYHILVASSREKLENNSGDIWDSGTLPSTENIN